jgi:hypothetical protein
MRVVTSKREVLYLTSKGQIFETTVAWAGSVDSVLCAYGARNVTWDCASRAPHEGEI